MSKSLGLKLPAAPDQLAIQKQWRPRLGVAYRGSQGLASQVRDGPYMALFYKVLCGPVTSLYGRRLRLHSCW